LTRAGFFVGTLQYVAPETLSGELVNEQADVDSLATIAYYMPSQELTCNGQRPRELFQQLLTQAPVPLNQAVKGLRFPGPIEAAVMRGLERDLTKRSKTVDEFATELCTAIRQGGGKRGFLASLFGKGGEGATGTSSAGCCSSDRSAAATSSSLPGSALLTTSTVAPPR